MKNTGFFRTTKKDNGTYSYTINNELVSETINRTNLLELRIFVEEEGYLWGIVDYPLALATCRENNVSIDNLYGKKGFQKEDLTCHDFLTNQKPRELRFVRADKNYLSNRGQYTSDYREKYEKYYGVKLSQNIWIHHINRNRSDDSIKNLVAVSSLLHGHLHHIIYLNTRGFVQVVSEQSPVIHIINHKYVYIGIVGETFGETYKARLRKPKATNWEYYLISAELVFVPAEDWDTLKHAVQTYRLEWNKNIPIIEWI